MLQNIEVLNLKCDQLVYKLLYMTILLHIIKLKNVALFGETTFISNLWDIESNVRGKLFLSCFCSVLCLLCLCVRQFLCALWSLLGKG